MDSNLTPSTLNCITLMARHRRLMTTSYLQMAIIMVWQAACLLSNTHSLTKRTHLTTQVQVSGAEASLVSIINKIMMDISRRPQPSNWRMAAHLLCKLCKETAVRLRLRSKLSLLASSPSPEEVTGEWPLLGKYQVAQALMLPLRYATKCSSSS